MVVFGKGYICKRDCFKFFRCNKQNLKLQDIGEADPDISQNYQITVSISKDAGTIKVIDNGIGMTNEEVKKYINQIAFSGVKDFIEKYKDKTDEQQIIGHFGLGFYSAFMVATKVQIDTLSYKEGAQAVRWISSGDTEYEMTGSERDTVGTTLSFMWMMKARNILNITNE